MKDANEVERRVPVWTRAIPLMVGEGVGRHQNLTDKVRRRSQVTTRTKPVLDQKESFPCESGLRLAFSSVALNVSHGLQNRLNLSIEFIL